MKHGWTIEEEWGLHTPADWMEALDLVLSYSGSDLEDFMRDVIQRFYWNDWQLIYERFWLKKSVPSIARSLRRTPNACRMALFYRTKQLGITVKWIICERLIQTMQYELKRSGADIAQPKLGSSTTSD